MIIQRIVQATQSMHAIQQLDFIARQQLTHVHVSISLILIFVAVYILCLFNKTFTIKSYIFLPILKLEFLILCLVNLNYSK